jgi:hypothetical protein
MTVPRKKHPLQARTTLQRSYVFTFSTARSANDDAPGPLEPWLEPPKGLDAEPLDTTLEPLACPTCGRPLFSLPTSMLLDLVCVALESLTEIKAALETEVLP